jgi:hypothetical protein
VNNCDSNYDREYCRRRQQSRACQDNRQTLGDNITSSLQSLLGLSPATDGKNAGMKAPDDLNVFTGFLVGAAFGSLCWAIILWALLT